MNKAQNRPTLHKVLSMILALVMVLSLLPMSGFTAYDAQTTAETNTDDSFYRIVHLDCGREYFSAAWIKALINEMAAAGYNQLQLAFGNGGFRFYLDDLAVGDYTSEQVKNALEAGNTDYNTNGDNGNGTTDSEWIAYNPSTNALTQGEMTDIISYAKTKGVEIVPMLNTPGHMHALIAAMSELGISGTLASKVGCLNLSNEDAVSFTKALVEKYAAYFAQQDCKFFNLATDEYSSFDSTFYSYADSLVDIVVSNEMTPRVFNDAIKNNSNKIKSDSTYPTQVCYWYPKSSVSASMIENLGYSMINTNHDYYYVSTNEAWNLNSEGYTFVGTYNESSWINKAKVFSNESFNNGKGGSTNVTDPVGSMFCIWCNTPGKNTETEIAQQIRMILRVIGARMQDSNSYSASSVLVDGGFNTDGTIYTASTDGGSTGGDTGDTTNVTEKTIKVSKNGTSSVNVSGTVGEEGTTYNVGDGTYATYTVKHNAAGTGDPELVSSITSGEAYLIGNGSQWLVLNGSTVSSTNDPTQATKWTIESSGSGYTIKRDSYYLVKTGSGNSTKLDTSSSSYTWSWSESDGFYAKGQQNSYYLTYNSGWTLKKNSSGGSQPYTEGSPAEATTTITFTGVAVTPENTPAEVTIGNVKYKIIVTEEDLSNVALPINIWITNTGVMPKGWSNGSPAEFSAVNDGSNSDGNLRSIYTLKASYDGVYSKDGIKLSSILPTDSSGAMSGTAKSWDGNTYDVVYWKNSYNTAAQRQSTGGWTNFSHQGTDFEYIRYWGGTWAYSVDGKDWTSIEDIGAASADTTKNQVNIWYRQVTEVTTEVTTEIVDWGPISYSKGQCLLDFAVQYETGERTPTSFPRSGKTIGFDCPTSGDSVANGYVTEEGSYYYRTVYGIAGIETADYEVYMITVTPSSDTKSTYINKNSTPSSYTYSGTEKIAWAVTEADAENSKLTTTTDVTYGGEPFLEKVNIYQYQGLLVTYYVRAKVTEDSLTVNYFKTTNKDTAQEANEQIYTYNIAVKTGTYFGDVKLPETKIDGKTCLTNGRITNKQDVYQYVSSDLTTMSAVSAQYRYSDYDCYKVEVSADYKTVNIYYTFNSEKVFVVDFGLPVVLKPSDFNANLGGEEVTITGVEIGAATTYAKISVDDSTHYITYTLTKAISGEDTFSVKFTGTIPNDDGVIQTGDVTYTVTIIPASTVYYEDSFAKFENGSAEWKIVEDSIAQTSTTQALEALGDKENVYGYDEAYSTSTLYSLGSAHKVTVSAAMAKDTSVVWPSATFTFKGTGFDIISLTDNTSGIISVKVYKLNDDGTETQVKGTLVNNYYGYKYENGQWVVYKEAGANPLYQIPAIKISGLDYATYRVDIKVSYASYGDMDQDGSYTFVLDAIRVYDPMGKDYDYSTDGEKSPSYVEIRKVILDTANLDDDSIESTGVVFIDGKTENVVASDYANYGPNHEAYLANSQAIAFRLVASAQPTSVQLGAKLANGTAGGQLTLTNAKIKLGVSESNTLSLNTSTDMYYELTDLNWTQDGDVWKSNVITLTNNGEEGSIISLTNLKFIGATYVDTTAEVQAASEGVALLSLAASPAMVNEAVLAVSNVLYVDPEPTPDPEPSPDPEPTPDPEPEVKTFEPETFKVSLNKDSIREGQKATLTVKASAEVEAITVNGETYDEYQTRLERSGWKWWSADRTEYHVFTVTLTPTETTDYEVIAVDAEGAVSEAETVTLTVKAAQSNWWEDMWNGFFGKWF